MRAGFPQPLGVIPAERPRSKCIVEKEDLHSRQCAFDENLLQRRRYFACDRVVHLNGDQSPGVAEVSPESREDRAVEHDLDLVAGQELRTGKERHGKTELILARSDRSTIDANSAHATNGGTARDVKEADERRDEDDGDQNPAEHPSKVDRECWKPRHG